MKKKKILKIIKRPYVNKRDRSILGQVQKEIIKKQKGALLPIAKAVLSVFNLGKNKKKIWQEEGD